MRRAAYAFALWLSLTGMAWAADYWQLPIPAQGEAPASHHELTRDMSAKSCGLCHPAQLQQWQDSIHAKAMSEGLAGQLRSTTPERRDSCLACHAPRSEQWALMEAEGPEAHTKLDGIDCAGCHVRGHQRFGPRDVQSTPHGVVRALPLFKRSAFCMKCHQFPEGGPATNGKPLENTYNEWLASRYSKSGQTCQSCHMANGKHEFKGIHDPEMTRQGLKVRVTRTIAGLHMRATNAGAGHALPTYYTPRITIRAETTENGRLKRANFVIQRSLEWSPKTGWRELFDTRLLPDQSIDRDLPLAKDQVATVTVIVQPDADYHDRVYPLLLAKQKNLTKADRAMLESARKKGISNEYVLYRFECGAWKEGKDQACNQSE